MTATTDFEVMHLDSRMVTAAAAVAADDAGDCLTSNGIWSVVLLDLLKSVEFQPLLRREPATIGSRLVVNAWSGLGAASFFICLPN